MSAAQNVAWGAEHPQPVAAPLLRWGLREGCLVLCAVVYPFHYYAAAPGDIVDLSVGDAVVAAVLIAVGLRAISSRVPMPRYLTPLSVFLLVAMASLLYPFVQYELQNDLSATYFDPLSGIAEIFKFGGSAAWMVAFFVLLRGNPLSGIRVFGMSSVIMACVFALSTIYDSLVHPGTRPMGPFENENLYANYLSFNVFLAAILGQIGDRMGEHRGLRVPLWLAVPTLLVGLLATGSRGALIGAVVAFPLMVRWRAVVHPSRRTVVTVLATVVLSWYGLAAFWQANSFIAGRVTSIVSGEGPNIESRGYLARMALEAFSRYPVLGIGYHQFPHYAETIYGWKLQVVHNTYLSIAAELGLIGLLVFGWVLSMVFRDVLRLSRTPGFEVARVIGAIILATLVQGFFANVEHYRSLWIATGMLAAMDHTAGALSGAVASARQGISDFAEVR